MSKRQARITEGLLEVGACYATSSAKHVSPNDGFGAKPSYHIHPDASYPHQDSIETYTSLEELAGYVEARKAAEATSDPAEAYDIMQAFYASLQ